MDAGDEGDQPAESAEEDERVRILAELNDELRQLYRIHVVNNFDANGEVSEEYQIKLARTLAKELPEKERTLEIRDLNRWEQHNVYWRDQKREGERSGQDAAKERQTPRGESDAANDVELLRPLDEKLPHGAGERLTDQIRAAQQNTAAASASALETAPNILSREQLENRLVRYEEFYRDHDLQPSHGALQAVAKLSCGQFADIQVFERNHPADTPDRREARDLLDYEHLAYKAGEHARWINLRLKAQHSPDAARYKQECQHAFETGHHVRKQREDLEAQIDNTKERQSRSGSEHTGTERTPHEGRNTSSDQQINPAPETSQAMERQASGKSGAQAGGAAKERSQQLGRNDTGRGGGRGR